jgi:4-diphosphocytidyl-2-C-methyl-D-erythritol kinase
VSSSRGVRMRALAPGKVNLALFLGGTREDGRHELVTLFQALSLADTLELEVMEQGDDAVICPGVDGENLITRALAALRARGWDGPPLRITVTKRIPVAAGMAGGSADAAAALRLAMAVPGAGHPGAAELEAVAAQLGADVPSQLLPGVSLGTGAGELVEHFQPLEAHAYVVVPSADKLATPAVYHEADRLGLGRSAAELEQRYAELLELVRGGGARPPEELLVNDLQPAAVSLCPAVGETLAAVSAAGADTALVSGSGPTVVGVFWGGDCDSRASDAAAILLPSFSGATVATPVAGELAMPELTLE